MRASVKSDLARNYRRKHGAEMATLKLARILYNENELLFKNVEDARAILKYIEGKSGSRLKKSVANTEFIKEDARPYNPYKLPDSDEAVYTPFKITGHKRVGILSDVHAPYHNNDALTSAITYLKKQRVDALLLNGDTIDCHRLSRFIKDPKKRDFKGELDCFKAIFDVLEKQLKCKIYFKIGNHENRYQHFLQEKAKELIGIEEFDFENIIKARARGVEIIESNRFMKLNNLNGIHGHEYIGGISAPVNVARGLYLRGKVSAFQGHNHASSSHTETDMNGSIVTTWSLGCLCELHPEYMPLNKWNHGFAHVELDENGKDFLFFNKTLYHGKVF